MFGVSFLELALVGLVALVVVGPQKLPEMMRTAGEWVGKLRRMTSDMRAQTGIDDILREEGIDGVAELRTLLRGERGLSNRRGGYSSGYNAPAMEPDLAMEFPAEGPDARGALPDDLLVDDEDEEETQASDAPEPASSTTSVQEEKSLPPPPTAARRIPPRATTQRETPVSKAPKVTISEPPAGESKE